MKRAIWSVIVGMVLVVLAAAAVLPARAAIFAAGDSVVDMPPGTYNAPVEAADNATLNISAGHFVGSNTPCDFAGDAVYAHGYSTIAISGGTFDNPVRADFGSNLVITGGTFNVLVDVQQFAVGNIYAGDFDHVAGSKYPTGAFQVNDGATVNIYGGTFRDNVAVNGGTLNIYGGQFTSDAMQSNGFATLNIYGGQFALGTIAPSGEATVNLYGTFFDHPEGRVSDVVSGILPDGSAFNGWVAGNLVLVPEPATAGLMVTALLDWRCRGRAAADAPIH